jgi:hypothetical protein
LPSLADLARTTPRNSPSLCSRHTQAEPAFHPSSKTLHPTGHPLRVGGSRRQVWIPRQV